MTTTLNSEWTTWHADREQSMRDPLGWLSITALHWLDATPSQYPDLPGTWWVDGTEVVVDEQRLTPVEGAPGVRVDIGGGRLAEVIQRTGKFGVRVHDPAATVLADFAGVPVFAPDPAWVVEGRFEPFTEPTTVTTAAVVDGLQHHHQAVGTIEFELGSALHRVVVFRGGHGDHILFTDATSGVTTYPTGRSLPVSIGAGGTVTLDFNRAQNLPCAFTVFATCPVAPEQNRLTVAVEAGEKRPS